MTAQKFSPKNRTSSTRPLSQKSAIYHSTRRRASGFTLIEVLVALAIFTVLLVIVFVPLTQATRFLAIGRTRASLQQSANGTMTQLQRDLSRAIYVYPNDVLPGVTDKEPYLSGNNGFPYIKAGAPFATRGVGNTSRLDLLLPEVDSTGSVKYPITPAKYIVTYYARRLNGTVGALYDPYTNPVVLYRAQYPYRDGNEAPLNDPNFTPQPLGYPLANRPNVSSDRYSETGIDWLTQSITPATLNEFDLEQFCQDVNTGGLVSSNHTLVTPNNVQLVAPSATWPTPPTLPATYSLKPNTTFNCADSDGDGKIDRVNINLTLMNFNIANRNDGGNDRNEPINGNVNFQRFTLSQVVNLPNIR